MNTTNNIDFLAIGDIVIDSFITLEDARVHCDINDENCQICMRWGDKIPYRDVKDVYAVGNSPNASVSAARLGLNSALMSHVGNDKEGNECLETLKENKVITDYMSQEDEKETNHHFVLSYDAERTILIKHEQFTYDLAKQTEGKTLPNWVYFSSIGENSMQYHKDIAQWVNNNNINLAFQPGTYQINLGPETLQSIYEACELFFCNVEEAQRILGTDSRELTELLTSINQLGPTIVCITDGPNGAYAYDSNNETMWFHPIYPDPQEPLERTGAGDAFSSTFTSALSAGKGVDEALSWAPINSMSVVQYVGAQEGLLSQEKLEEYLNNAPDYYKPQQLT